jgi:hypothetical protein
LFGALFFLAAGGLFLGLTAMQLLEWDASKKWVPTPCTITVFEAVPTEEAAYDVHVGYLYTYAGAEYGSSRARINSRLLSVSDTEALRALFESKTAGTCYVNPHQPERAVLFHYSPFAWSNVLVPTPFVLFGLFLMIWRFSPGLHARLLRVRWGEGERLEQLPEPPKNPDAPLRLRTDESRWGGVIAITLFAGVVNILVWSGMSGVFTDSAESISAEGLLVGGVIGGLASIITLGMALWQWMAVLIPRPRVTIEPGSPRIGDTVRVRWEVSGPVRRIQTLRVALQGRYTYFVRGSDGHATTDREFANIDLLNTDQYSAMHQGDTRVTIPERGLHSVQRPYVHEFAGVKTEGEERVEWRVRVSGEIARWRDLNETFTFVVRPNPDLEPGLVRSQTVAEELLPVPGAVVPEVVEAGPPPTGAFGCFVPGIALIGVAAMLLGAYIAPLLSTHIQTLGWREAPCTIEKFDRVPTAERDNRYDLLVRYGYEVNGSSYTGKRYALVMPTSLREDEFDDLKARFDGLEQPTCLVNPRAPTDAVLTRALPDHTWNAVNFAGIVMMIGAALLYGAMRAHRVNAEKAGRDTGVDPSSPEAIPSGQRVVFWAFLALGCNAAVAGMFMTQTDINVLARMFWPLAAFVGVARFVQVTLIWQGLLSEWPEKSNKTGCGSHGH